MTTIEIDNCKLMLGDCLERFAEIPDGSVDAVICDPPYGTTACKWDSVIPFELMWQELKRVAKPNSAIVLFGAEPFSSMLRTSNLKMFKYDWYWRKTKPSNHLNCKIMPMAKYENISVFYEKSKYYPQGLIAGEFNNNRKWRKEKTSNDDHTYGGHKEIGISQYKNYPSNELNFANPNNNLLHPTQKPVSLCEYLIKTYSNEGETICDFTFGSGTTAVACVNTNRKFIGIEKEQNYFDIAVQRVKDAGMQTTLFDLSDEAMAQCT